MVKLAESLHSSRFFCSEKCPLSGEKEVPSLASEKSQDFKSTCKECPSILTVYTTILAVDSTVSQQDAWKKAFCIEQQNGGCGRIRRACWNSCSGENSPFRLPVTNAGVSHTGEGRGLGGGPSAGPVAQPRGFFFFFLWRKTSTACCWKRQDVEGCLAWAAQVHNAAARGRAIVAMATKPMTCPCCLGAGSVIEHDSWLHKVATVL